MVPVAGEQTEINHLAYQTPSPVLFILNLSERHAFGHITEAEERPVM